MSSDPQQPDRAPRRPRAALIGVGLAALLGVGVVAGPRVTGRAAGDPAPRPAAPSLLPPLVRAVTPPEAPRPIAGWIIDGNGLPIEGARIAARDAAGAPRAEPVETDADGAFRLDLEAGATYALAIDGDPVFPAELRWHHAGEPSRIMVHRRVSIDARVLAGDAPVAGAEIYLSDGSGPVARTELTDDDGLAHFADLVPGSYELWARHGGAVSALLRVTRTGTDAEPDIALQLAPAAAVHGQVHWGGAAPASATMALIPIDLDHAVREAPIDADGRFAVDAVPAGRWRLEVDARGYGRATEYVVNVRDARVEIEVRLRPAGVVTGVVVDPDGAPVVGATLVLRGQAGERAASAADVTFLQRARTTSPARLRWTHPLAGERHMPLRDTRRFGARRPGVRAAECGAGHCGVDLGTERGSVVHAAADGRVAAVVHEVRKEAGRFVVLEHDAGLRTHYLHLDEIRADLEVGQRLRAGDPVGTLGRTGVVHSGAHLHFAVSQERDGRTWYLDPEPMLQHAVVLPQPAALDAAPAEVDLRPTLIASMRPPEHAATAEAVPPPESTPFSTDEHGRFRLEGIAPGTYVASAFHPRLASGASASFRVRTGEETDVGSIRLSPGVVIHGQVLARGGGIVPFARVTAQQGEASSPYRVGRAYAGPDGRFLLRPLDGPITLTVSAPGYGEIERTLTLASGDGARRTENFELVRADAQLSGRVTDPAGFAAAGATVRIVDGPTRGRTARTDGNGHFALDQLAAGSYVLELSAAGFPATRATATTGEWSRLALRPGGAIRLRLRDAHTSAPLAGIRVEASGPSARTTSALSDTDGSAALRPLVPGRWTLRVRVPGRVATERVVDVSAGADEALTLELARGATLAGTVRDRYGRRVAGARVFLGAISTRTDQDGHFRLTDLPTGPITLHAEHDAQRGTLAIELAPGDEFVTLQINLQD